MNNFGNGNIANAPPYLESEVLKAYSADGLPVTGKGQVIAILIDTFLADVDLQAFLDAQQRAGLIGADNERRWRGKPLGRPSIAVERVLALPTPPIEPARDEVNGKWRTSAGGPASKHSTSRG